MKPGVFEAKRKDGSIYYRGNITYKSKHISIGSFDTESKCAKAYQEAKKIFADDKINLMNYQKKIKTLDYEKVITLINYRDNHIYIKNPIYLYKNYFIYYLSNTTQLKFDNDDLFYYSSHKIIARGGHLFVNDYGMQYNILSRYGIKPFAVKGRDYIFANGDDTDMRYSNIVVVNKYHGVTKETKNGKDVYLAKIHINGDYVIGRFDDEATAAVAYNKALDYVKRQGLNKDFPQNYVLEFSPREYADVYTDIKLPRKILFYFRTHK